MSRRVTSTGLLRALAVGAVRVLACGHAPTETCPKCRPVDRAIDGALRLQDEVRARRTAQKPPSVPRFFGGAVTTDEPVSVPSVSVPTRPAPAPSLRLDAIDATEEIVEVIEGEGDDCRIVARIRKRS